MNVTVTDTVGNTTTIARDLPEPEARALAASLKKDACYTTVRITQENIK